MDISSHLLYLHTDLIFNIYSIEDEQLFLDLYSQKYVLSVLVNLTNVTYIKCENKNIEPTVNFKFDIKKIFTNNKYNLSNNPIYKKFEKNNFFEINVQIDNFNKNYDMIKLCSIYTNLDNLKNLHEEYNFTNDNSYIKYNKNTDIYFMELIESNSNCSSLESSVNSTELINKTNDLIDKNNYLEDWIMVDNIKI